jgi:preprotein translocase subunit SecF
MMQFFGKTRIDFMKIRYPAMVVSTAVNVIGILVIVFLGFSYGLDFSGGTLIEVNYKEPADLSQVRRALDGAGFEGATVQHYGSSRDVLIRLQPRDQADSAGLSDKVFRSLNQAAQGQVELRRVEFVGPQVGKDLAERGGLAILYALLGILIYVALRFEYRYAIGAIVATIHDIIVTAAFFAVFRIEFDLTVLAAILAVLGYSLNDTIIIYDRIRENFHKVRKGSVIEIVNLSVNETLSRSVITHGTTFLTVLSLYLFGGAVVHGFSVAMMVGIIVGTYSSIYVASSAAVFLGISRADMLPVKKEGETLDGWP